MVSYNVKLIVSGKKLPVLLEVIENEREIQLESLSLAVQGQVQMQKHCYLNGKKSKGISGVDLILSLLTKAPSSKAVIDAAFKQNGFASSSASAALSNLRRDNKITGDAKCYRLATKGEKHAS